MSVPIIDLSPLFQQYPTDAARLEAEMGVAKLVGKAAEEIGFLVLTGHNVDQKVIDDAWSLVRGFFDQPLGSKMAHHLPQAVNPFGYSPLGEEMLSSGKAAEHNCCDAIAKPDLKEMFTVGPEDPRAGFPPRALPAKPEGFADAVSAYYSALASLAKRIMRLFALALQLEDADYFDKFLDKHASALRCINYPAIPDNKHVLAGQCRASSHTDYGTITILRADGPGLQVSKDVENPVWLDVPVVTNCFIINLGDLMRRWTNDKWLSTLHRVVVLPGADSSQRRQSMAFFHNINRDAEVSVLLRDASDKPRYPPIIAGDFLMQKHLASMGMR